MAFQLTTGMMALSQHLQQCQEADELVMLLQDQITIGKAGTVTNSDSAA